MKKDNFFKSRDEVNQFFKGSTLRFEFQSDNTIYFKTLQPMFLGGELFCFQLSFYNSLSDFFSFSSLNEKESCTNWLSNFQLSEVNKISEVDNKHTQLFFNTYDETDDCNKWNMDNECNILNRAISICKENEEIKSKFLKEILQN